MRVRARRYEQYRQAIGNARLPAALVDLEAVDHNLAALLSPVRASGKTLRVASKSLRSVELLRYVLRQGGATVRGVMAYSPAEARFLAEQGFDDILVAYPTAQPSDVALVAPALRDGARVSLVVDNLELVRIADAAAEAAGVRVPLVVDVDLSYRAAGGRVHLGVRRSPLHTPLDVADLAQRIGDFRHVELLGLLAYEAHIAAIDDRGPLAPLKNITRPAAASLRRAIADELARRGIAIRLFNGGGTGSLAFSSGDDALTEVTAGSGILDSHLFDGYRDLHLEPAACFALQVTRRPAPGFVTCQGGGFVASGSAGMDRLPIPYLPEGLRLTRLEGAGEVQTPLVVPAGIELALGAPVFFRHAKAGELAEHFASYALVRGDRVESVAPTYRGMGQCFG